MENAKLPALGIESYARPMTPSMTPDQHHRF
jgi:hypothetical protein